MPQPGITRGCKVIDSWVGRFPQAVTCFSPGSYANRPRQALEGSNVFVAGDWVKGVEHGANGLSQVFSGYKKRMDGRLEGGSGLEVGKWWDGELFLHHSSRSRDC